MGKKEKTLGTMSRERRTGLDASSILLQAAADWAGHAAIIGANAHYKKGDRMFFMESAESRVFTSAIQYAAEAFWQENLHPEVKKFLWHYLPFESEIRKRKRASDGSLLEKASSSRTTANGGSRRTTARAHGRKTTT